MGRLGMTAIEARNGRLARVLAILAAKGEVDVDKARSLIAVNTGVTRRKALEYLTDLKDAGKVSMRGDTVSVTKRGGG
jgi:CRP-like cAMP-binding protein